MKEIKRVPVFLKHSVGSHDGGFASKPAYDSVMHMAAGVWHCSRHMLCVKASKSGIVEAIQIWMHFKQQMQLNQKFSAAKRSKLIKMYKTSVYTLVNGGTQQLTHTKTAKIIKRW